MKLLSTHRCVLWICLASLCLVQSAPAEELTHSAQLTRRLLDTKRIALDVDKKPLADVMDLIGDKGGFHNHLDPRVLHAEGVTWQTPVTVNSKGEISLGSALQAVLNPLELTYDIDDRGVVRTVPLRSESQELIEKIYDLSPLLIPRAKLLLAAETNRERKEDPFPRRQEQDLDKLLGLMIDWVRPETWKPRGAGKFEAMENVEGVFLVTQTEEVHAALHELIEQLVDLQSTQVMLTVSEAAVSIEDWKVYAADHKLGEEGWALAPEATEAFKKMADGSISKPRRFLDYNGGTISIALHEASQDHTEVKIKMNTTVAGNHSAMRLVWTTDDLNAKIATGNIKIPLHHSLLVEIEQQPNSDAKERHFALITPTIILKATDTSFVLSKVKEPFPGYELP